MAIKKIMGTETEYGVMLDEGSHFDAITTSMLLVNCFLMDQSAKILWDYELENPLADARGFELDERMEIPDQRDNLAINKVLTNGARYYVDHAHPEFSTPECPNVRELLRYEKAGERILELSRQKACELTPSGERIFIYKNNSDHKGNSYGHHENYLVDRAVPFAALVTHLTPFLVTRQIYAGAGKVGAENGTPPVEYQLSQRADFFETLVGLDTMAKRPIINTRDEPHADREKYRRLHVIVGDSNMSEYTTYLKMGVMALVLEMIEDNVVVPGLALRNPVLAIREVSHDVTCRRVVELEDGRRMRAVEIQRVYWEVAQRYFAERPLDAVGVDVLAKWGEVLDRLERDPMQLHREIDWVIKCSLFRSYMDRRRCGWDDPRIAMMDLQYHDVRRDRGLYYLLERQGGVERILKDEEIEQAIDQPPSETRAYFRGMCLKKYRQQVYGVNWDSISFNLDDTPIKRILMMEPSKGTKAHVEELLERSSTAAELLANLAG